MVSILIAILAISGTTAFFYFKVFNPNEKLLATKVDTLGLENRAATMIENMDNDSLMARLQREDAHDKIEKTDVKSYHIRLKLKPLITSIVLIVALSLSIVLIPDTKAAPIIPSSDSETQEPIESDSESEEERDLEDEIIEAMIQQIIKIIDESGVKQELKDQLYDIVDQLRIDLQTVESLQAKIDLINEARDEILRLIEEALEEYDIGHGMLRYQITSLLGSAIIDKDLDGVDSAIDLMEAYMRAQSDLDAEINALFQIIDRILTKATKEENEALIEAVEHFRGNLRFDDESTLSSTMDTAAEEIKNALLTEIMDPQESEEQQELEELEQDIDSAIQDALDQLEQQEQQDSDDSQGQDSDAQSSDDANKPPHHSDDPLDSEPMIDGNTPYLNIYTEYYNRIMEAIASDETITDEERQFIEKYLDMLK